MPLLSADKTYRGDGLLFSTQRPSTKSSCGIGREDDASMQSHQQRWDRRPLSYLNFTDVAASPGPIVAELILSLPVWVLTFADQVTLI